MAHSCPDCDATCYCNGDIDDIILESAEYERECDHYLKCIEPESDEEI